MTEQEEHEIMAELYADHTNGNCAFSCPFCEKEQKE